MRWRWCDGKTSYSNRDRPMTSRKLLFILFFMGSVFYISFDQPLRTIQEKEVYFKYCKDYEYNFLSCPKRILITTRTYKLYLEKQMVIEGPGIPFKLEDCIVFDRDNWKCKKNDGEVWGVWDGLFYEKDDRGSLDQNRQRSNIPRLWQITKTEYLLRYLANKALQLFD